MFTYFPNKMCNFLDREVTKEVVGLPFRMEPFAEVIILILLSSIIKFGQKLYQFAIRQNHSILERRIIERVFWE